MDVMTLVIPVQETSSRPRYVGLSVEESHPEESKPSSVDPVHYVTSTGSSEDHNNPPSQVSKETQTDFVPEESNPGPEFKFKVLEDITLPGSSDMLDQQKTPPGDERRVEKKRKRKRKKRPVIERREMVSAPDIYSKTQSQSPSLVLSAMASDIFSKLAVRVIFFIYLFGFIHAASSPSMMGQWHVYTFATETSLFNTRLTIKIDQEPLCEIPPTNLTHYSNCTHKESSVYWINSTSLLLLTTLQSDQYFLEHGPKIPATPELAGSFNTSEEALQDFHLENKASAPSQTEESAPGWGVPLTVTLILVGVGAGIGIIALLVKYNKCPGENFRMKKGYSKGGCSEKDNNSETF
ncbi:uncharacterized protein LOC134965854 [Pseudophryne corroboree]|uniref:uncharacterized protein LOC134965854 n=1 Tax=Pseudophryne corroboree TaxID=495146 RepID=UPI003081C1A4